MTNNARPAWLLLADQALDSLRVQATIGTPAFPFARRPALKTQPAKTVLAQIAEEDLAEQDLGPFIPELNFADGPIAATAPEEVDPRILRPDPRHLQALLRLSHALGSLENWEACLAPGALTLVETGASGLIDPLYTVLQHGFAGDLHVTNQSDALGDLALHRLVGYSSDGRAPTAHSRRDIARTLEAILANPTPAVVLVESLDVLTEAQQRLFGTPLTLPPLTREILAAQIELGGHGFEGSEADLQAALPDDAMLAEVDMTTLSFALRAGDLSELCARLVPPPAAPLEVVNPVATGPTLSELPIPADLKELLTQVSADLLAWQAGTLDWSEISRGVLLVGPPGVGKTETGRALARGADIAFVECSMNHGLTEDRSLTPTLARIKESFDRAKAAAPSVLFLDEIDAIGNRATAVGHNASYDRRFVTALNEMIDGFEGREGDFIIGTANYLDHIDPALRRSGRFDRVMRIGLPDRTALTQILRLHLGGDLPDADLDRLAADAVGASGADVAAAIRSARGLARGRSETFAEHHLLEILGGKRHHEHPDLARRIAIHEAGHAIVASCVEHPKPIRIAFVGRGAETTYAPCSGPGTRTERDGRLATMMAGREAEILMLGEAAEGSGGSSASDLAQATLLVLREELSLGLGENGALWLDEAPDPAIWFLRDPKLRTRVEARLAQAAEVARGVLEARKEVIERIADVVMGRREVEGEVLEGVLETAQGFLHRVR